MRRGGAGLLAVVLALAGCKSTDSKTADKEPSGTAASRAKNKDGTPKWLDPVAGLPGAGTTVPKGGNWSDPTNAKADAQDAVGGKVVDTFGRPAKNVFVRVEAVNGPPGAAAMGIYTDGSGYFFTRGLKPGKAYNLTAEATQDGKQLTGSVQTQVPNPVITLVLREDLGLPPGAKGTDTPTGGFPPPPDSDRIPPVALGPAATPNTPRPKPTDASFSPGHGATNPVPATIGPTPGVAPPPGAIPQPDDLSNDPPKPVRPENVADGPKPPYSAPPASIPGPPSLPPSYPNPVPPPATPDPKKMGVRVAPGANFALVDTLERDWDFATDKSGSVVLLEFVTTACPNCKPAVPILKDLQSRYAADGLQVVAVLCDELPQKARAAAASKYARDNNTNYAVYVEPGATAGAVRDRLGVEAYPTAVLLDATGAVLWKGHPAKRTEIENAVRRALGR
jgi:thiol-disulfide isomerase/thioredoxin